MLNIPLEKKAQLENYLTEAAKILREYTETEKLNDFETIELEVRKQMMEVVSPHIGAFFLSPKGENKTGKTRKVKTIIGEIEIGRKQAKKLGLEGKVSISPNLKKCCLRSCAKTSYQQAEEDLRELMGIKVGHSTLHRLVERVELPLAQAQVVSEGVSIDGGKICLRGESQEGGQWRDYKLVSLHDQICEAFFQDSQALLDWGAAQPLSPILTCLGDGHEGIWNLIKKFGQNQVPIKREVLDWYHLKENLYKVGGSLKRLEKVEFLLWNGGVDAAIAEFDGLNHKRSRNFQSYLNKHRQRIPCYKQYQQLGIPIGSGDVESKIKQVGARVKLSGARWNRRSVPLILRLRCAHLNPLVST